jgi:hypothetical protein
MLGHYLGQNLFVPTAVEVITERRTCAPSEDNDWTCPNEYEPLQGSNCIGSGGYLCSDRGNKSRQFYFLADIENVRVRLSSTYGRGDVRGSSLMHPAYMGVCEKLVQLAKSRARSRKEDNSELQCDRSELRVQKIPCQFGSECHALKSFRLLEDSGVAAWLDWFGVPYPKDLIPDVDLENRTWPMTGKSFFHPSLDGIIASQTKSEPAQTPQVGNAMLQTSVRRLQYTALVQEDGPRVSESQAHWHWTPTGPGVVSDDLGDVFALGHLLRLAGVDLDADRNKDNWTIRQAGTMLEVQIVYSNLYSVLSSFGYRPVWYHYEVKELVLPYVSQTHFSAVQPPDFPAHREWEQHYGVLINFKVGGTFGVLDVMYVMIMISTALGLMSVAPMITDLLATYVLPMSDNFYHLKTELSPEGAKMWECELCGFWNEEGSQSCQGVPKFEDPKEIGVCGHPRIRSD